MVRLSTRPLALSGRITSKLNSPLDGPFEIKEILSDHRIKLVLPKDLRQIDPIFTIDQVQPVPPDDESGRPGLEVEQADKHYEPERILDERMLSGRHRQFLVKWKGFSRLTWTFEQDLVEDGATEVINEWNDKILEGMRTPSPPPSRERNAVDAGANRQSGKKPSNRKRVNVPIRRSARLSSASHSSMPDNPLPRYVTAADALDRPTRKKRKVSIDGVLYWVTEKPVAFSSKATKGLERKLVGGELESAGLFWAWRKLAYWLEGSLVSIITDHSPLGAIVKSHTDKGYGPHMSKLRTLLGPHLDNITFFYREGMQHSNVDALSRIKYVGESVDD